MMSCQEVTRLASEARERQLTMSERFSLRIHTMVCTGCRRFQKHVNFLSETMNHFAKGTYESKRDKDK